MRRLLFVVAAACFVVACSNSPQKPGRDDGTSLDFTTKATIVLDDNGISPVVTKARVGDAITVTNRGTKDRGLTSETVETGTLRPGESTTVFLTETGTIELSDRADLSHHARIDVAAALTASSS